MSAIYRSYEVLAEETAGNHKTRRAGKTSKKLKPYPKCGYTISRLPQTSRFQEA